LNTKIYITGPIIGRTVDQLHEFAIARERIEKLGFTDITTAADDIPVGDNFNKLDAQEEWMKRRAKNFEEATVVLHMPQYEYDELSIHEVQKARHTGKEKTESVVDFISKYANAVKAS